MKKILVLSGAVVVLIGYSCKKYKNYIPLPVPPEKKWVVSTFAGEGSASFVNGSLAIATFNSPNDLFITLQGTFYVTDALNFSIRKISGGQVSTFAGGTEGYEDANGMAAKFKRPCSITMDGAGNLYTTDENDPRIRKITPAGDVYTYAGKSLGGFADGNADTAKFLYSNSILADALGNVYVSDVGNHRIRKVSVNGKVTTVAGTGVIGYRDGTSDIAQFTYPRGIAIDRDNNLYIADGGNFRIRKITPNGVVSTIAGSNEGFKDGVGAEARFSLLLSDIVIDAQRNLYVTDGNRIRKITQAGEVTTIAGDNFGGYRDGDGPVAQFNFPTGLTIDVQGNLYVSDNFNNRIRKISLQ